MARSFDAKKVTIVRNRVHQSVLYAALALATFGLITGCSACRALGFDQGDVDTKLTAKQPEPETKPAAADSDMEKSPEQSEIDQDTEGDINVVWTAKSGSARVDPIGVLNGTPLSWENPDLNADKTVAFKPNVPDATSSKGRYVYTLRLHPTGKAPNEYSGYLKIDWTMSIVRSAKSANEFHSIYSGTASAMFDPKTRMVSSGVVKGTVKTSDTFTSSGSKLPPYKTTGDFVWTFASK